MFKKWWKCTHLFGQNDGQNHTKLFGCIVESVSLNLRNFLYFQTNLVDLKKNKCSISRDVANDTTYTANATLLETTCNLPNGANVSLQMFMFKEAANITGDDGNIYQIVDGGTKVNIIM